MRRTLFKAFKKRQDEVHPLHQEIRDKMIAGSGWTRKDGSFPLQWRERKAQSLGWTCIWSTGSSGLIKPEDWYPLNSITPGELIAEAEEYQARCPSDFRVVELLNPLLLQLHRDELSWKWFDKMLAVMPRLRGLNKEYVCTWDMPPSSGPGMLMNPVFRPGGWGPEHKAPTMKKVEAAYARGVSRT